MYHLKTAGKRILRETGSKVTNFKLISPPTMREDKINLTTRVKNEKHWIRYCLLS